MSTKIAIGEPVTACPNNQIQVFVERYSDEAPECITIDGRACLVVFDPGTVIGRTRIEELRQRLVDAVAYHDKVVEEIYGQLKTGDYCQAIRLPGKGEQRCTYDMSGERIRAVCSRVEHADGHHVTVDLDNCYEVVAVVHPGNKICASELAPGIACQLSLGHTGDCYWNPEDDNG